MHRTLQDFLAAQYSVKTGEFARKTKYEWNARTSYCACLMDDCTDVLMVALHSEGGLSTAAEILDNTSTYDPIRISKGIVEYFSKHRRTVVYANDNYGVSGELSSDFIRFANTRTLNQIIEDCSSIRTPEKDIIAGYAIFELQQRKLPCDHSAFKAALKGYGTARFTFALAGLGQVSLASVSP